MSEIKYGLISQTDARTLEKTIDLICNDYDGELNVTEIGLYNCATSIALKHYINSKGRKVKYTGIDNQKDKPIFPPDWMNLIIGNSNEVYNQITDNSQHLLFIDSCHCFSCVVSDFFCYSTKVKIGGYLAFHDTGKHIKEFKDFQHGDKENPLAYISVRKALWEIGLLASPSSTIMETFGWALVFDEANETDEAGGICVFKKVT